MKRCWIHIGMHKTGSTTIQRTLSRIRSHGSWKYLTLTKECDNLNEAMFVMFASNPLRHHTFRNQRTAPEEIAVMGMKFRKDLEKRIRASTAETIILSAESLDQMDTQGVVRLEEFLRPLFHEIRVIGYVRPPAGLVSSSFQEKVKHGKRKFEFSKCAPAYRFRFRKYDKVFGPDRVDLFKFTPKEFTNQCVLADFCERIGIVLPPDTRVKRINEGLCKQACAILFAYHQLGPGYGSGKYVTRENRCLVKSLIAMRGTKFKLAPELVAPVLMEHAADIHWMEKRLGTTLAEPLHQDEDAIMSEQDLLIITPADLRGFARSFANVVRVPEPVLPAITGDHVEPQIAAAYVQSCREIAGEKLREEDTPTSRRRRGFISSLLTRMRKALGIPRS
jgi:hypothetical protein